MGLKLYPNIYLITENICYKMSFKQHEFIYIKEIICKAEKKIS